jgi:hypothetical protein
MSMSGQSLRLFTLAALLVSGLLASFAMVGVASADRGQGRGPEHAGRHDDHPRGRPARIEWDQRRVVIELAPGETKTTTVRFTASRAIAHATLEVRPGHAPLTVTPQDLGALAAGAEQTITLTAELPADEHRPRRQAVVFVHDGQRALGPPLRVVIRNTDFAHRDDEDDEQEEGEHEAQIAWLPPVVRATVQPGSTFTTTVSFVAHQALNDARVVVRAQEGLTATVSPANLGHVAANQAVTLTVTVHVPANTDRERFAADIVVFDDDARLAPPLRLRLRVPEVESEAAHVAWTPPIILASVQPGATYTTTVSFVASHDLTDAQLRVRAGGGLSVTTSPTDLGNVSAGTPVTVTITAQVPAETERPFFIARLAVRAGDRTIPSPLWIILGVVRP